MTLNKKLLVIDSETTGITPGLSSVIQLGAIFINKDMTIEKEGFNAYIKPYTLEWTQQSESIHGITQDFLNKNAIKLDTFCTQFKEWCGDPKEFIVAQWACGFDTSMLQYAYKFSGQEYPFSYKSYDIASIARFYCMLIGRKPQSLKKTANILGIKTNEFKAHDAYEDARMTCLVFKKVYEEMSNKINDKNK